MGDQMNQLSDNQHQQITINKCAASDSEIPVTAEEDIEFDLMTRRQANACVSTDRQSQINQMVAVANQCTTTSFSGICTALYDAGCRLPVPQSRRNHG